MALIKSEEKTFLNLNGKYDKFQEKTYCNSKGEFSRNLPKPIHELVYPLFKNYFNYNNQKVTGNTLEQLNTRYNEIMSSYNEVEETEEYVICYEITYDGRIRHFNNELLAYADIKDKTFEWLEHSGHYFDKNLTLSLNASTYLKKTSIFKHINKTAYHYSTVDVPEKFRLRDECYPPHDSTLQSNSSDTPYETEIPYSEDMKDFFDSLIVSLSKLILKISTLSEPKNILNIVENKIKFLD